MSDDLYEAVSQKMQPRWMSLSGSVFDTVDSLNRKQQELDKLKAWAESLDDRAVRKAYRRYFDVVEYTIKHGLEDHAKKQKAIALMPSIPEAPRT